AVEPREHACTAVLTHPDGYALSLRTDKRRVSVHGRWPHGADGQYYYPHQDDVSHITCAFDRGAHAIARDIERRLLPHYVPLGQQQDRRRQEAERADREAVAVVRRLEPLLDVEPLDHDRRRRQDSMHVYFRRARFTVHRYGSFHVEFSTGDP